MPAFNRLILMGNLTRDPELSYANNGTAVCKFDLAVNSKYKDKEDVLYVGCVAFGKAGEVINQYCGKGDCLHVTGRLKLEQWTDKQTQQKRQRHGMIVDSFQFIPRGSGGGNGGGQHAGQGRGQGRPVNGKPQEPASPPADEQTYPDDAPF